MSEPKAIDPLRIQESWGTEVARALFDPLVTFDPVTSEIQPLAAEDWEPNEDCTVWTFHLRKRSKFHNGREVARRISGTSGSGSATPRTSRRWPFILRP
jgi:peptide/nickel transport system substrate-binding protein/oligopeptide transport system substrate-binding protein